MRMERINRTMTKMLQAHSSMRAAKLLSAAFPLPRLPRKERISGGAAATLPATCRDPTCGTVGGVGRGGPDSRSVVMRLGSTKVYSWGCGFSQLDCIRRDPSYEKGRRTAHEQTSAPCGA